jgi:hypothetical protein
MRKSETNARKRYEKPEAKRFPMRPDEAVLGGCKTNGTSGPGGGGVCKQFGNPCSGQSS